MQATQGAVAENTKEIISLIEYVESFVSFVFFVVIL